MPLQLVVLSRKFGNIGSFISQINIKWVFIGKKIMKLNSTVFSQLVAMLQSRPVFIPKMFAYELHSFPPAISDFGALNLPANKSTLIYEILPCHNSPDTRDEYNQMLLK